MKDALDLIADVLIIVAGCGAIVFVASYAGFFAWRKTPAGRALMYFAVSLVSLFILNGVGRWTGNDYYFREPIRVTVYLFLTFTVWRLVYVLWHSWRDGNPRLNIHPRTKENQ